MGWIFIGNTVKYGRFVGGWCVFVIVESIQDGFGELFAR